VNELIFNLGGLAGMKEPAHLVFVWKDEHGGTNETEIEVRFQPENPVRTLEILVGGELVAIHSSARNKVVTAQEAISGILGAVYLMQSSVAHFENKWGGKK
jgi:hypothetical protein